MTLTRKEALMLAGYSVVVMVFGYALHDLVGESTKPIAERMAPIESAKLIVHPEETHIIDTDEGKVRVTQGPLKCAEDSTGRGECEAMQFKFERIDDLEDVIDELQDQIWTLQQEQDPGSRRTGPWKPDGTRLSKNDWCPDGKVVDCYRAYRTGTVPDKCCFVRGRGSRTLSEYIEGLQ